jgi:hypothetical protein
MGVTGQIPGASNKPAPAQQLALQLSGQLGGLMPVAAPTASFGAGAGIVDTGTHVYAVAFLFGTQVTPPGPSSAAATSSSGNQTASLSAIPTGGTGCTGRILYRSKAGQTLPLYVCGVISDNSTTTFTDVTADADLGDPAYVLVAAEDYLAALQLMANTLIAGASAQIGPSGTPIKNIQVYAAALTPASVAANTTAEQTFTVTGLATSDKVFVNKPSAQAGLAIGNVRVSAANTLAITYVNDTAGAITPTAETYQVVAIRS